MAARPGPHPHPDRRSTLPPAPAKGFVRAGDAGNAIRRIVVSFDVDTFNQIAMKAKMDRSSFAAAVRDLVEWGLEA